MFEYSFDFQTAMLLPKNIDRYIDSHSSTSTISRCWFNKQILLLFVMLTKSFIELPNIYVLLVHRYSEGGPCP